MRKHLHLMAAITASLIASTAFAAETEKQYLTGKGKDDAIPWDFMCNAGMKANQWAKLPVPSNWEMHGFGNYTYGREAAREGLKVQGKYKRTFTVPPAWEGKTVNLVFDGSMTDTQAFINGQPAGPMHQGGYYRFKYDVSKLLKIGQENLIEVTVDDDSANASVNNAERRGDYWNFAGIFRPVYLEALPATHVQRVAIDARADGSFNMDVYVNPGDTPRRVTARILDTQGRQVGQGMEAMVASDQTGPARLTTRIASPRTWNAETPHLYHVEVNVGAGTTIAHTLKQRFGFRTIEIRRGDTPTPGLFVNGARVMLKGANRHSFWPESGRTLSEQISRDDILLMQEMNMNSVRMSHYPPDEHFLDLCDELGMYVLNELAGWQRAYDTPSGRRLIEEMIVRDVNHPSILFLDNGNEGGWNAALDDDFAKWDPQNRNVLHPWSPFRGVDTKHYPVWSLHTQKAAGNDIYMPTEMMHALFDGGGGAGLEDYWNVIQQSKVGGGAFIWALVDETVKRADNGKLDSKGNLAPDGIVGPYREREASFYTVKYLWSPIVVTKQEGTFTVENRYGFLDAKDCSFTIEHRQLPRPGKTLTGGRVLQRFQATTDGSIPPGAKGKLVFPPSPGGAEVARAEVTTLIVKDPAGRELWTYTWPDRQFTSNFSNLIPQGGGRWGAGGGAVRASEEGDTLAVAAGDLTAKFSKTTGQLVSASRAGKAFSLTNGLRAFHAAPYQAPPPRPAQGAATAPAAAASPAAPPQEVPPTKLTALQHKMDGGDLLVTATYSGELREVSYRVRPSGWITMDYAYHVTGPRDYFGVAFDYPEAQVKSMRYLGEGPYRVWKNRLAGTSLGVWDKTYNDTATGHAEDGKTRFDYPEFKGHYAGVRWLQLQTAEGPITVLVDQKDAASPGQGAQDPSPLYVQVLTPRLPTGSLAMRSGVPVGKAGLAFLHAIPPIGNKFNDAAVTGPLGQRPEAKGDYRGTVSVFFGDLPG